MTLSEELLTRRELTVFIGVENHSTSYNPFLFDRIWNIPNGVPLKDLLIIPINGLSESYMLSKQKISCYGRALWVLFVKSPFFTNNAFLFDSFPQTDDNNYFKNECVQFLLKANCRTVTICDMGVYKSRSLVNLLNCAISSFAKYNISVCLVQILGYNSRGYTDIEVEDECEKYQKDYYLDFDVEVAVMNDSFFFIQMNRKFFLSDLFSICCMTKSPAELKLQDIKEQAEGYVNKLKPLLDMDFLRKFILTLDKGDSFDFVSLESNLTILS